MYVDQLKCSAARETANAVREHGFYYSPSALSEQYVDQMLADVNFDQLLLNHNDVGVVTSGTQKFLTHCLAKSKRAYDLITSQQVLDICNAYFSDKYRLTNHRFCQTRSTFHMPWHTDNNLQLGSQLSGKHNMPGLLFLFYLSEQNQSPFQYIKDSQRWSHQYDDQIYLGDQWVEEKYRSEVLTFNLTKGSLIICDTHGIHRAAPFCDREHVRNILLFQVDQVGDQYTGHGEQNLVNAEFIDHLSPEISDYLGFGARRDYPAFPNSSAATMTIRDLINLQKQLLPLTAKAVTKSLVKMLLPGEVMVELKRLAWAVKTKR